METLITVILDLLLTTLFCYTIIFRDSVATRDLAYLIYFCYVSLKQHITVNKDSRL